MATRMNPAEATCPAGNRVFSFWPGLEARNTMAGPGAMARPVSTAGQCQEFCRKKLTDSSCMPVSPNNSAAGRLAMVNTRLRNSRKSITGTGERRVLAANPAAATTVTAQQTLVAAEPHPAGALDQAEGSSADADDQQETAEQVRDA